MPIWAWQVQLQFSCGPKSIFSAGQSRACTGQVPAARPLRVPVLLTSSVLPGLNSIFLELGT